MPITRNIDHSNKVVITRCHGEMTETDIQVDQRTFWSQDWLQGYGEVFDMRAADFTEILGMHSRYAAVVASNEQTNVVPVAMLFDTDNESQRLLAQRYITGRRALSDDITCEGFDDLAEATAWLAQKL